MFWFADALADAVIENETSIAFKSSCSAEALACAFVLVEVVNVLTTDRRAVSQDAFALAVILVPVFTGFTGLRGAKACAIIGVPVESIRAALWFANTTAGRLIPEVIITCTSLFGANASAALNVEIFVGKACVRWVSWITLATALVLRPVSACWAWSS